MKLQNIKLGKIIPNLHRNMETYPINGDKVDALKASMEDTGVWPNIIVRPSKGHPGFFEQAYGHHRIVAATDLLGTDTEIFVVLREDLSDIDMLKLMAHENLEAYTTDFRTLLETWEATVKMAAAGSLPGVKASTNETAAEYSGAPRKFRYVVADVAKFLGWLTADNQANNAARACGQALTLIGAGHADRDTFVGVGTEGAMKLTGSAITALRQIERAKQRAAKNPNITPQKKAALTKAADQQREVVGTAVRHTAKQVSEGNVRAKDAGAEVTRTLGQNKHTKEVMADTYVKQTRAMVQRMFDPNGSLVERLDAVEEAANLLEGNAKAEAELLHTSLGTLAQNAGSRQKKLRNALDETPSRVVAINGEKSDG